MKGAGTLLRRFDVPTGGRGPLVYGLKLGQEWRWVHADVPGHKLPHADCEVYPTTPWNYALAVSETTLAQAVAYAEQPLGALPFSPECAPCMLRVHSGRRLPGWQLENGSAGDTPPSPVQSTEPLEMLTRIPYGCTNLRVSEFPLLL